MLDRDIVIIAFILLAIGCYYIAEKDTYKSDCVFSAMMLFFAVKTCYDNYYVAAAVCMVAFIIFFSGVVKRFIQRIRLKWKGKH